MEEDIKDLKKYISFANKSQNFSHNTDWQWHKELAIKIENLIKGYKELEEENEVLEEVKKSLQKEKDKILKENAKLKNTNKTLYELCQRTAIQEFINNECDYIPKSKVREIIEDIDNNQPVIAELKLRKLVEGDK